MSVLLSVTGKPPGIVARLLARGARNGKAANGAGAGPGLCPGPRDVFGKMKGKAPIDAPLHLRH
ncbi:MAG: hypothetical protein AUK37_00440 [Rhodobacterales bacterium CG2_30_65_12]|nr:MAG: hypothetical protein AUK37_00440 [Rhodobacterales bacterium CG2_30_65_12]